MSTLGTQLAKLLAKVDRPGDFGADVDTMTDRHGRPYSLVCTKNQASYERRARQRTQDLADIARLGG
jgi:hypothetical protein